MMNTKELRLRNYVIYEGLPSMILGIHAHGVDIATGMNDNLRCYCYVSVKLISPFPITEELLLECGFDKTTEIWDSCFGIDSYIFFLHQLQNLYFIITMKELNIDNTLLEKILKK